jgi:hypothetical protein
MNRKSCKVCNKPLETKDHYMVKDFVWFDEARLSKSDISHLFCLEKVVGRELEPRDFTNAVINYCGAVSLHKLPQKDFSYLNRYDEQTIQKLTKKCIH